LLTWRVRPVESSAAPARVGVVASRASVGDAVHRNRAKRRLGSPVNNGGLVNSVS
ncbi:MAG: ribonuclease P protein component, partial [Elusimicrobia bacterium]|nr:ribonuclease P protein component [Elusimicrobiota bacterium]